MAIPFRSIEPGPESLLTQDDPNTQGIAVLTIDATGTGSGAPAEPGDPPNLVRTQAQLADAGLLQGTTAAAFTITGATDTGISLLARSRSPPTARPWST